MQTKKFFLWGVTFALFTAVMICIAVIVEMDRINNIKTEKQVQSIQCLYSKVDSLERVINTEFKHKQDTIIINVVPQNVYLNIK